MALDIAIHFRAGSPVAFPEFQFYSARGTVLAKKVNEPFSADTPKGAMRGRPGDYLVEDHNYFWVLDAEVFERRYQHVDTYEGEPA